MWPITVAAEVGRLFDSKLSWLSTSNMQSNHSLLIAHTNTAKSSTLPLIGHCVNTKAALLTEKQKES